MPSLASVLAVLQGLAPVLEPILLQAEQGSLIPALNAAVSEVSSPDVKLLLQALVGALNSFASAEIQKL